MIDRGPHRRHFGRIPRPPRIAHGKAGQRQHLVARRKRQAQRIAQPRHHAGARPRPPGFEKGDVPRRNAGLARQIELAETARLAPALQGFGKLAHAAPWHEISHKTVTSEVIVLLLHARHTSGDTQPEPPR
jgi:hypothetical protein